MPARDRPTCAATRKIGRTDVSRSRALLSIDQRSTVIWLSLLAYFVLAGGTPGAEYNGLVRGINAGIAVVLITRWIWTMRVDHDATDRWMLAALLPFLAACVLSMFPRQSLDAAVQATALVAAFYFARRRVPRSVRPTVETAGAWLCVALSVFALAAYGATWFDWLTASGGTPPPLSLVPPTGPFGHRHDVAVLVTLLVPFLWTRPFRGHRLFSIIGSVLAISVVLVDASRNLELAVVASSVIVIGGSRLHFRVRRPRLLGLLLAAVAVAAIALVANSPVLVSRIANVATVLSRISLWNESIGVWLAHPFAGVGPGGFPFSYMLSHHFHFSLFDPRHPDNAVIQLVVEAGLLGLAAGATSVIALVIGAHGRWRREPRATWTLLVFAFASLGTNPTEFVFLVVPAIVWAAFLVPADANLQPRQGSSSSLWSPAIGIRVLRVGNAVVAAAVLATAIASVSYQIGWMAYQRGDRAAAATALDLAIALDPSLGIYRRERASLSFADAQWEEAAASYGVALQINYYDPVAWRGLALAELAMSHSAASIRAAKTATDLMFLSPQNQIVLAAAAKADRRAFEDAMRVALEQAPQLAVIDWDGTVLGFADRVAVTRRAVAADSPAEGPNLAFGRLLLATLTGRADVARTALDDVPSVQRLSAASLASLAECDLQESAKLIGQASRTEGELGVFWIARSIISAASRIDHQHVEAMSLRMLRLTDGPLSMADSALDGDQSDTWRFRRAALGVQSPLAELPSSGRGLFLLLSDPASGFSSLGTSWPPGCQ